MNTNQPLRDESQLLTDAQILGIGRSEVANMHRVDETDWLDFARAVEAEVRSLRSQDEPVAFIAAYELDRLMSGHDGRVRSTKFGPSQLDGDVALYASPPSQPIASDVVAAPDGTITIPFQVLADILFAATERDDGNRVRWFDSAVDAARAVLPKRKS